MGPRVREDDSENGAGSEERSPVHRPSRRAQARSSGRGRYAWRELRPRGEEARERRLEPWGPTLSPSSLRSRTAGLAVRLPL